MNKLTQEKSIMGPIKKTINKNKLLLGNIMLFLTSQLSASEPIEIQNLSTKAPQNNSSTPSDYLQFSLSAKSEAVAMTPVKRRSFKKQARIKHNAFNPINNSSLSNFSPDIPKALMEYELSRPDHQLSNDGTTSREDHLQSQHSVTKFLEEEMNRPLSLEFSESYKMPSSVPFLSGLAISQNEKETGREIENNNNKAEFHKIHKKTYHDIRSHALEYRPLCSKTKLTQLYDFLSQLKVLVNNKLLLRTNNEDLYNNLVKIKEDYSLFVFLNDDSINSSHKRIRILDLIQSFVSVKNNGTNPCDTDYDRQCKALEIIYIEFNEYCSKIAEKIPQLDNASSMLINCTCETTKLIANFVRIYEDFMMEIEEERHAFLKIMNHFWQARKNHILSMNKITLSQMMHDLDSLEIKVKSQETIKSLGKVDLDDCESSPKSAEKKKPLRFNKSSPELKITAPPTSSVRAMFPRSKSNIVAPSRLKEHHSHSLTDSETSDRTPRKNSGNSQQSPRIFAKKDIPINTEKM